MCHFTKKVLHHKKVHIHLFLLQIMILTTCSQCSITWHLALSENANYLGKVMNKFVKVSLMLKNQI
jgi:hypothetical protein